MSEVLDGLLIFVVIYMIIWGAITSFVNEPFASAWASVTCSFPDYATGYDESCSFISHPASYSDDQFVIWNSTGAWYSGGADWVASIPYGWATFAIDSVESGISRIGYFFFALFTLYVTPEITFNGDTVDASAVGFINGGLIAFAVLGAVGMMKGWI